MKKTLFVMLLLIAVCISTTSHSQCSPEQYRLAEQGLEKITPKLTGHINTLDYIATDLRALVSKSQDDCRMCKIWVAIEIIEHHSSRAWYNRLLLQNLSSLQDAVNLSQLATILRFSQEPLSDGIHQLQGIYNQTKAKEQLKLCESAKESMNEMMTVYDQAVSAIRTAISEGENPPAKE